MCNLCLLSLQNKLKKIKEKYKDQDEEDRELMMQLLGVRMTKKMILNTVVTMYCTVTRGSTPSATFSRNCNSGLHSCHVHSP